MERPSIAVFYCTNTLAGCDVASMERPDVCRLKPIVMACSGMTRDVFILRAFEAGADAVAVLVCPEAACRHGQGSMRARKRVDRVRGLLDDIGLGGERLSIHTVQPGDLDAIGAVLQKTAEQVQQLGPNPAACANACK